MLVLEGKLERDLGGKRVYMGLKLTLISELISLRLKCGKCLFLALF